MTRGWLVPAVLLLAACTSSNSGTPSITDLSVTPTTTTTIPPTTSSSSTTSTTSTSTTTTTTTVPCPALGDTATKQSADPLQLSFLLGADIRTGDDVCHERIVIELQGEGEFPGWAVAYVPGPVTLGQSNETVEIAGNAILLVRMGMWMQDMEFRGYTGPTQIFPTNVDHIREMRMVDNWEGVSVWAIGLDEQYPFTVDVYDGPPRLVIDIQVREEP